SSAFTYSAGGSINGGTDLAHTQSGTQTLDEGLSNSFDYSEDGTFTLGSDANGPTVSAGGNFSLDQSGSDHYYYSATGGYLNLGFGGSDGGTFTLDQSGTDHADFSASGTFTSNTTGTGASTSATGASRWARGAPWTTPIRRRATSATQTAAPAARAAARPPAT